MSERPPSVLFGVPMPQPGVLTAGQRWTAALAVVLAALLLVSTDGGRTLLSAPAPVAPTAAAPMTDTTPPVPPASSSLAPLPSALPPASPGADLTSLASPAPEPAPAPDQPPSGGAAEPPPEDDEPGACPVPMPAVLAGAGLCPPA